MDGLSVTAAARLAGSCRFVDHVLVSIAGFLDNQTGFGQQADEEDAERKGGSNQASGLNSELIGPVCLGRPWQVARAPS